LLMAIFLTCQQKPSPFFIVLDVHVFLEPDTMQPSPF
jgi:hypothetical protein